MKLSNTTGAGEYIKAQRLGQKEKKELLAAGKRPFPAVLDEIVHEGAQSIEIGIREIPADMIRGTVSAGRISAFSASFLPLPEPDSEFAMKWIALCEAHLSDTGIRDPIECFEYLGEFYVSEGNKRVSVLRYFGAVRIPARIRRIMPQDREDPRTAAYFEFLDFFRATGLYDIRFTKTGDYARLVSAAGKAPGEEWTEREVKKLSSAFRSFKETFLSLTETRKDLRAEEALLLFLKVYSYEQFTEMNPAELKKALLALRSDFFSASEPDSLELRTLPNEEEKGVISKLISGVPKRISAAFIHRADEETSSWTRGHAEGARQLARTFADAVTVRNYFHADTPEAAEMLLDQAAADGAELIFTTDPPLLIPTLKAAVRHPKVRFFNCSAFRPLASVTSYYCRTYEGKFITGMIAGALAENDLVGYIGSYPILGVPASINAFALGARMTNPRARILLEWSCTEVDCVRKLREKGVRVISNRDIPVPDPDYLKHGYYGTFMLDAEGGLQPIASPVWVWGKLYENIVRTVLHGSLEKKELAVNYWWGMDSGVIDVALSELVPSGVRMLAETMMDRLKKGEFDIFAQKLTAADGTVISDGSTPLSWVEILKMDKLSDAVEGHIPEYGELFPMSRELVRELGVHRESIPPGQEENGA